MDGVGSGTAPPPAVAWREPLPVNYLVGGVAIMLLLVVISVVLLLLSRRPRPRSSSDENSKGGSSAMAGVRNLSHRVAVVMPGASHPTHLAKEAPLAGRCQDCHHTSASANANASDTQNAEEEEEEEEEEKDNAEGEALCTSSVSVCRPSSCDGAHIRASTSVTDRSRGSTSDVVVVVIQPDSAGTASAVDTEVTVGHSSAAASEEARYATPV